jgi:hypothetical protein
MNELNVGSVQWAPVSWIGSRGYLGVDTSCQAIAGGVSQASYAVYVVFDGYPFELKKKLEIYTVPSQSLSIYRSLDQRV